MATGLDGRVVVVTGAGRGIGREEALALARLGARVVVNDVAGPEDDPQAGGPAREVVSEIEADGGTAVVSEHDVADFHEARRVVAAAVDTFGRLDGVVNNAGILRDRTVFTMRPYEWDAVVRVNLRGHFCVTRWATAYWRDESKRLGGPVDGRLVHTSSESGLYGAPGQSNYDAAKSAIPGFSLAVARECRRYGVTSNVVCPRAYTRLTAANFESAGDDGASESLHPRLVAPWIAYLVGPDAREVTGQCFVVGGGVVRLVEPWPVVAEDALPETASEDGIASVARRLLGSRGAEPVTFPQVVPGVGW